MQRFWFHEDPDQYRSSAFSLAENEEKRCLHTCCLIPAGCAGELYREDRLRADEVHAIYDVLSGTCMNRAYPAEWFIPVSAADIPFE